MRIASSLLLLLLAGCIAPPDRPAVPAPAPTPPPVLEVAVTVDDLPVHGPSFAGVDRMAIAEQLLDAFRRHRLPPVHGFVNGKTVDDDPATEAVLRRWIASGNPLGNHTWSHPSLNKTDVPAYLADIEKGEAILKKLLPDAASWKFYRYPFLFEGDTLEKHDAVRGWLGAHGYAVAEVTIDADDWAFNAPFARCTDRGDKTAIAALRHEFVEAHVEELRRMRALTQVLVQRDVRHVLLLHVGAADASAIHDLLSAYEREGVRWVDLRTALADPFYASDPRVAARAGAAFPYVVAKARGVSAPPAVFARGLEERLDHVCR